MPNADIKEKVEEGQVHAIIIVEILGRPADHIEASLKEYVETIRKEKGVKIINKKLYPAKGVEKQNLFTSFAEIEMLTENFQKLAEIVFRYMPSSIEIIEPKEMHFKLHDANLFVNDLAARLHRYDEIAKTMLLQNAALENKIKELQGKKVEAEEKKESSKELEKKEKSEKEK